jgi:hypothetical protein
MRLASILKIIGLIVLVSIPVAIGFFSRLDQSKKTGSNLSVGTNIFPKVKSAYGATDNGNVSGTGTITHLSFEGGFYGIVSDDGNHYDPSNLDPEFQVNGLRVRFEATTLNAITYHMWGISIRILHIERLDETTAEIKLNAYNCLGDLDKLTTPYNNAIDGDWDTKIAWNTSLLGDFTVSIVENYSAPTPYTNVIMEFKAYHYRAGSLMPTPMDIQFWNGSSWKEMYELDDEQHLNETFIERVGLPVEAFVDGKITIKTTVRYSSHVAGGIPPYGPIRLLHYVEYYEGKLSTNGNNLPLSGILLIAISVAIAAVIVGSVIFLVSRRNKHASHLPTVSAT